MRIIDPGEFRNIIEIQREVSGKDEDNRPTLEWKPVLEKVRAKVLNVRGEEFFEANGKGFKVAKTFYIRALKSIEITENDRIVFNKIPYNIIYVNDIEERGVYLEIKTEYIK
ncbi:phage head closure protein [Clostridium perfringens]|uniref:phage head closure protein n=1 Tax=Clostridium TaxID=1485 RepID=UPI000BC099AE|nr:MULTISPECIES: phage head closure protein [Clostridium]ASY51645.1 head-tail adaptor protein [Clostridium perfringens]MCX0376132.1 phage head closure protein [Clostridium perfringens]MCX0384871.1 phage head closure protein [Clostridium perfringens]MDJ8943355.1 phage head closure protein [Clostridium perfringens]MDM0616953.1 phage head closure protein [Clostridium perfringens]